MLTIPRIVIAGTHSGCGKTTVATGIMAALTARGLAVQPFKVGPDFIDPSHHTRICGRPSRNLDPFMMGEEGCLGTFGRAVAGADIAVIEGVMGMYDGVDGSDLASTAHVAKILMAPLILVVDAKGMSRSVHALINGYREFDPAVAFAGVIFNRVGSDRHRRMVEASLEHPCLGWIPRQEELVVKSRHLGLTMAHETGSFSGSGEIIEESCNLDTVIQAAARAGSLPGRAAEPQVPRRVSVGVAYDEAFCFYYRDNLDRLSAAGADLLFFSPLRDRLPEADALYIGGGYPELHLPLLETSDCTKDIGKAAEEGMPVYAECGGLMYLSREVRAGTGYRMSGVLPAVAEMTDRVQALGYVKGMGNDRRSFMPPSMEITGHEFHYSRLCPDTDAQYAIHLTRGKGIENGKDGLVAHNAMGCYTHAYFTRRFADAFVSAAERFSKEK
jgi:cobyrinic acid a,c-diamide synthase